MMSEGGADVRYYHGEGRIKGSDRDWTNAAFFINAGFSTDHIYIAK